MPQILITTPSISLHDAVSNDVWMQERFLRRIGWDVYVYAEHAPASMRPRLVNLEKVSELITDAAVTWIHHHSVFWDKGNQLFRRAKCRIFLRYHNITPSVYFERYKEAIGAYATKQGIAQTQHFVSSGEVATYLGASWFNCEELIAMGAKPDRCIAIAPFHTLSDFDRAGSDEAAVAGLPKDKVQILFVGRVVPNKGHLHLLAVLDSYIEMYGPHVQLNILGNLRWAPKPYIEEIKTFVREKRLASFIRFWGSGSFDVLHTLYNSCDVFLVTSEHEGFCVPVIEAQFHRLPVVALDRTAVGETLGQNQLSFKELDYKRLAAAVHICAKDAEARNFLVEEGFKNQARFAIAHLEQQLLKALNV